MRARYPLPLDRRSFTLIELLIVIAVVAVLSVVVVLVLNPAELLKQARDSNRIADMEMLNKALTLYLGDRGGSLGTASTTYLSLVDLTATSTAGTNCAGVGLTAPAGWSYHCAASSTARKLDGTGWIPLNFSSITFSPPFSALPLDPTNTSSSGLYYLYIPGSTNYALAAGLQSNKYLGSMGSGDQGVDPARLETGSNRALISQGEGLIGYWPLDETSGSAASDQSGNGRNGTYTGSSTLNQAPLGSMGGRSVDFVSQGGHVDLGVVSAFSPTSGGWTMAAWAKPLRSFRNDTNYEIFTNETYNASGFLVRLESFDTSGTTSGRIWFRTNQAGSTTEFGSSWIPSLILNATLHVAVTYDGTNGRIYLNGSLVAGPTALSYPVAATLTSRIGGNGQRFNGILDDVRFYSRPLSAPEILSIYNAQK
jgi:prepilin-type N-terminal cleavage/methylation domain-containing protein